MILKVIGLSLLISIILLAFTVRFGTVEDQTVISWGIQNLRPDTVLIITMIIVILASIGILSLKEMIK